MADNIVIQMPEAAPGQLFLLFHGVGMYPQDMAALGRRLAEAFPTAAVVSVAAPDASDLGTGYQWFSAQGVTDANRPGRIAAAMPRFLATVRALQAAHGVTAQQTAVVGFSQGAIMALAATQSSSAEALAGRVIALAGRFAVLPSFAPVECTLHLLHGKRDSVVLHEHSVQAAERLVSLGGDVTADIIPGVGHSVANEMAEIIIERLQSHIPKRIWDKALSGQ